MNYKAGENSVMPYKHYLILSTFSIFNIEWI